MNYTLERRRYIKELLEAFFKPLVESADRGYPFNWDNVAESLKVIFSDSYDSVWRSEFFSVILQLLKRYECTDMNLLVIIVKYYCLFGTFWRYGIRACKNINETYDGNYLVRLMKLEYGELKVCTPLDPVRIALRVGNENWLDYLVQHGFVFVPPRDDSCEWDLVKIQLPHVNKPKIREFARDTDVLEGIYRRCNPEARKRMLLVFSGFSILALHGHLRKTEYNKYAKYVRCFQKIFQTIPEPHITSSEIRGFLQHFTYNWNAEKAIQEISDEYEESFPESRQLKQPRSLLHLSRCQVRQNLRSAGTLLHGVDQLRLPNVLKAYVLLQNYTSYKRHLN